MLEVELKFKSGHACLRKLYWVTGFMLHQSRTRLAGPTTLRSPSMGHHACTTTCQSEGRSETATVVVLVVRTGGSLTTTTTTAADQPAADHADTPATKHLAELPDSPLVTANVTPDSVLVSPSQTDRSFCRSNHFHWVFSP